MIALDDVNPSDQRRAQQLLRAPGPLPPLLPLQTLGGDTALAILLTVASNVASVFTLPLLLPLVLASSPDAGGLASAAAAAVGAGAGPGAGAGAVLATGPLLDSGALLRQLVVLVLVPTTAGAAARAAVPGGCTGAGVGGWCE